MNKLLTGALTIIVSAIAYSIVAIAPQAHAQNTSTANCVDPTNMSNYETTIQRGTGTLTVKGGKALCAAQDIVFESFNVPDTWDRKGWNNTAIPQTKFASTMFTIPAGVANYSKTISVATPADCKNTQVDFYIAPEYESITTLTGDDARNISGILFAGKGACETPVVVKDIKVCDLKTYTVSTIKEDAYDASKYSKDTANCKKPVEKCPLAGKENMPKDSADCVVTPVPTTPVTPKPPVTPEAEVAAELPRTGVADAFAPIMGIGSLTASGYYYLTSRRNRN